MAGREWTLRSTGEGGDGEEGDGEGVAVEEEVGDGVHALSNP